MATEKKKKILKEAEEVELLKAEEIVRKEKEIEEDVKKIPVNIVGWKPRTKIGGRVKANEIRDIDELLEKGIRIMEPEIIDMLLPNMSASLLLIGQSKGKFGGGQRRVFKQTQKKTREGNKPRFATIAVIGDSNGHIGVGYGKSKETVPAREKAIRNAKLNLLKIRRGCGSWQCGCQQPHTIPFKVEGRCGSVTIKLMPAPKGKGLCIEKECAKILKAAGIRDVWSKTRGQTRTKINLIYACMDALKGLVSTKVQPDLEKSLGLVEGAIKEKPEGGA